MKYKCKTNSDHIFDHLPDDYWCPLCGESKSMLEPIELEVIENQIITKLEVEQNISTIPNIAKEEEIPTNNSVPPIPEDSPLIVEPILDTSNIEEDGIGQNKAPKSEAEVMLDFQFPFLLDGAVSEFMVNDEILFEFKAHKSFTKIVSLPLNSDIEIRLKSKFLRIFQSSSKFEMNFSLDQPLHLIFAYNKWTGKYKLAHK